MAAHLEYVGEALRVIAVVFDDQDTNGHAASLPCLAAHSGRRDFKSD
jgi:hypothetical protein